MKTTYHPKTIGNITYYLIIAPEGYSIFNTVCFSEEEAEITCRAIDEIIMRIIKLELLKEMEQKHFKKLKLFIESLKELEEIEEIMKKQLEEIMKEVNEWLDSFFSELQENPRVSLS